MLYLVVHLHRGVFRDNVDNGVIYKPPTQIKHQHETLNTKHLYNIYIMLDQRRDVGPTLYKCYTNVLSLLRILITYNNGSCHVLWPYTLKIGFGMLDQWWMFASRQIDQFISFGYWTLFSLLIRRAYKTFHFGSAVRKNNILKQACDTQ